MAVYSAGELPAVNMITVMQETTQKNRDGK